MNKLLAILLVSAVFLFGCNGKDTGQNVTTNVTAGSLSDIGLPNLSIQTGSLGNLSGFDSVSFALPSLGLTLDVSTSMGNVSVPSFTIPMPTITVSASSGSGANTTEGQGGQQVDCNQFASVPSCSYVPASVQDQCRVCKGE